MKNNLEEIAREKKREYMAQWREKNRAKAKEYNERYWLRKAVMEIRTGSQLTKEAGNENQ